MFWSCIINISHILFGYYDVGKVLLKVKYIKKRFDHAIAYIQLVGLRGQNQWEVQSENSYNKAIL